MDSLTQNIRKLLMQAGDIGLTVHEMASSAVFVSHIDSINLAKRAHSFRNLQRGIAGAVRAMPNVQSIQSAERSKRRGAKVSVFIYKP